MSLIDDIRHDETVRAGASGAIAELVAAADLMRRGYEVFRALSPICPCDLLAYRKKEPARQTTLRVEVRSSQVTKHGMLNFRLKPSDQGSFDVLALVVEDDGVYYLPQLIGTPRCPYKISIANLTLLQRWGTFRGAKPWQGFEAAVQEVWPPMAR